MKTTLITTASVAILLSACATGSSGGGATAAGGSAEAKLASSGKGEPVTGTVVFVSKGNGIGVTAHVTGLTPGAHGFHIHEKGDCSAADFTSAGGHYNPGGQPHGHPHQGPHHAGDMPMLQADAYGTAKLVAELPGLSIEGKQGIVGLGVIVHAAPDDFKTQPTGNSGGRVACGVIVKR